MSSSSNARQIHSWPDYWYDEDNNIRCPARECRQVFHTREQWSRRQQHFKNLWGHRVRVQPTETDHHLLLLLTNQTKCPKCPWALGSFREDIRELFKHEQQVHGSSDTHDLNGFVRLVRRQAVGKLLRDDAEVLVLARFCQLLAEREDYATICEYVGHSEDDLSVAVAHTLLSNAPPMERDFFPVPAHEFLDHFEPIMDNPDEKELRWKKIYDDLKSKYEAGSM